MNLELILNFFMWCSIINYSLLLLWVILFIFAHDLMKKLNEFLFRRKLEYFDTLHYAGIGLYKIAIFLFNIIPLISLFIITKNS
jgi:hypothetical protein